MSEIISSNIVFQTVSTLYAAVVLTSKQLLISCFTNPTTYIKNASLHNIRSVLPNILEQSDSFINNVLLLGDTSLDNSLNTIILNATIKYVTST